jgi:hypothetical protein
MRKLRRKDRCGARVRQQIDVCPHRIGKKGKRKKKKAHLYDRLGLD